MDFSVPRAAACLQLQPTLRTNLPGYIFFPHCLNGLSGFCQGQHLPYESTTTFKVQTLDSGINSQAQSRAGVEAI
jgi:hypothetical protein